MQPVPRSFQAHRPVLDEAWPAQPPGSPRYDPKQNFRLPLELEILTNRRCAPLADGASRLGLNKVGVGRLVLTAASTYTGGTTITAGILQIGNGTASGSITGNITDNGVLEFNRPDTVTFPGTISGAGSLTQSGTGVLILTGTNTYTGGTTISSGTLQIGAGGSITGNVVDNGFLAFDEPGNVIFTGTISGSGNLTQNGTGSLILTAENTFTGTTTVTPGSTVQLGNGGSTGSVVGNIVDDGTLRFNRSGTLNYSGVISGTGSVQQDGPGTTILSGANTYSGGTVVNAGTLTVNNAKALGLGDIEVNGGILRADPQPIDVAGNYTQNAGGTLQLQLAGASSGSMTTSMWAATRAWEAPCSCFRWDSNPRL